MGCIGYVSICKYIYCVTIRNVIIIHEENYTESISWQSFNTCLSHCVKFKL